MSVEQMIEKIEQLSPEGKQQIEALINQLTKEIPDKNENKTLLYGILKGKVWMSPDFDEPLEEFKEYM